MNRFLTNDDFAALLLSLRVSALATLACLIVGLPLAYWLSQGRSAARTFVHAALYLPLTLPPVVSGLGLLLLLQGLNTDIVFTWWAAAAASAVMAAPLLIRPAQAAFESVDSRLLTAAATLGASASRAAWTITLPLAWRGIVAGITLAWARALGEFGATIVVAGNIPHRTRTAPLAIWTTLQSRGPREVLPLVVASLLLSLVAVLLAESLSHSNKRRVNIA